MAKTPKQKTMAGNHKVGTVLATGVFLILCLLIAFPLVCGLLGSFRDGAKVITTGMSLDLHSPVSLLVCYFIAYGLTMYTFKLQGFLFFMVIATMSVPFEILMLPLYQEITKIGLVDSNAGVFLPGLCAAGTIFFFKQYMVSLPKELLDAARVDGCTEYGISIKIMMPITKPAFASQAIMCAMGSWNNMLWPMLVFRDTSKFTLQIGLNTLLTPYGNNYNVLIAGSMFGILPILAIYLVFNRYLVEGMTSGAVKG